MTLRVLPLIAVALRPNQVRICSLLLAGYSNEEIAELTRQTADAIKQQLVRLCKRAGLPRGSRVVLARWLATGKLPE